MVILTRPKFNEVPNMITSSRDNNIYRHKAVVRQQQPNKDVAFFESRSLAKAESKTASRISAYNAVFHRDIEESGQFKSGVGKK